MMGKTLGTAVSIMLTLNAFSVEAKTLRVGTTLPKTGTSSAMHNPPCQAVEQAKTIADKIKDGGINMAGKTAAALGLGSDAFNMRRLNQSTCADLCVILPSGADFKVEGNITPWDQPKQLPNRTPVNVEYQWAALEGPIVKTTDQGDVICYTAKNWKHDTDRAVGLIFDY